MQASWNPYVARAGSSFQHIASLPLMAAGVVTTSSAWQCGVGIEKHRESRRSLHASENRSAAFVIDADMFVSLHCLR
jgi:hypothetical protein